MGRWPPARLGGNRNIVCNGLTAKQTGEEGGLRAGTVQSKAKQIGEGGSGHTAEQCRAQQSRADRVLGEGGPGAPHITQGAPPAARPIAAHQGGSKDHGGN